MSVGVTTEYQRHLLGLLFGLETAYQGPYYIGLLTVDPTDPSTTSLTEIIDTNYSRINVSEAMIIDTVSSSDISSAIKNNTELVFPAIADDHTIVIKGFVVYDSLTGGNLIISGRLGADVSVAQNQIPVFTVGQFKYQLYTNTVQYEHTARIEQTAREFLLEELFGKKDTGAALVSTPMLQIGHIAAVSPYNFIPTTYSGYSPISIANKMALGSQGAVVKNPSQLQFPVCLTSAAQNITNFAVYNSTTCILYGPLGNGGISPTENSMPIFQANQFQVGMTNNA